MNIIDALLNRKAVTTPPPIDPGLLESNPALEAEVQPNDYPVHPLVAALQRHLGLLNLIRNTRNQKQAQIQKMDNY